MMTGLVRALAALGCAGVLSLLPPFPAAHAQGGVGTGHLTGPHRPQAPYNRPGGNPGTESRPDRVAVAPADITQDSWVVWIDSQDGLTAVEHDIVLINSGTTPYVGREDLGGGKAVLRLPMAGDAENLQFLGFISDTTGRRQDTTYVHTAPIPPGRSQAALRYETRAPVELTLPVAFPTKSLSLRVPNGMTVRTDRLIAGEPVQDRGATYRTYTAANLKPGETVRATLTGQVPARRSEPSRTPVLGGALAAVAIVAAVLWVGWRRIRTAAGRGVPVNAASAEGAHAVTARPETARPETTRTETTRTETCLPGPPVGLAGEAQAAHTAGPANGSSGPPPTAVDGAGMAGPYGVHDRVDPGFVELMLDHLALLDLAHEGGVLTDETGYLRRRRLLADRLTELLDVREPADRVQAHAQAQASDAGGREKGDGR